MANLNYAEQWSPELLEILMQGNPDLSVCDQQCKMAGCKNIPFYTDEYNWL